MKIGVVFYHSNIRIMYPHKWIEECFLSIYNQSYGNFVIYELNYGDDNFRLHKFFDIEKEYHFFNNKFDNHADAMNFILKKCVEDGCDFVFNTNMDDRYHVDRFKIQLKYLRSGYDIVSSNFKYIDEDGKCFRDMFFSTKNIKNNLNENNNIIAHPCVAYSKKFILNNVYKSSEIPREDILLWKRSIENYNFIICDDYLLEYRIHKLQVSGKKSKKIGLLLICTNKYYDFLDKIIESADKYFLEEYSVTYYIFSNLDIKIKSKRPICTIKIDHKKWPWMTLGRYEIFSNNSQILKDMDYLYYSDVDMEFKSKIGDEILSNTVVTLHPGFYDKDRGTPEDNIDSKAYIPIDANGKYYAGGFNGGTSEEYLKMSEILSKNINDDFKNNIIAKWHDESHLNKYFFDNKPSTILNPGYCYPEGKDIPFECKILALTKDHKFYREEIEENINTSTGDEEEKTNIENINRNTEIKTPLPTQIIQQPIINNRCRCGEIKNKVKFNFCQRCGELY